MPLTKPNIKDNLADNRLKLLTGNIDFPGGDTAIDMLRNNYYRERLLIQRISLMLIVISALTTSLAATAFYATQSPRLHTLLTASNIGEALLLSTLLLGFISYARRIRLRMFSVTLIFAVSILFLQESKLIDVVAARANIDIGGETIRLLCMMVIVIIGYYAHCVTRREIKSTRPLFFCASTRVFLTHLLPLLAVGLLVISAILEEFFILENAALIEHLFLHHAYSLLLIAALTDVFAVDHSAGLYRSSFCAAKEEN